MILVPHRAKFSAEILDYCDPGGFERLEDRWAGRDPDEIIDVLLPSGNARNREWRSAVLRRRIQTLSERTFYCPAAEQLARLERLKKELEEFLGE